jgi:hypothetical protein
MSRLHSGRTGIGVLRSRQTEAAFANMSGVGIKDDTASRVTTHFEVPSAPTTS